MYIILCSDESITINTLTPRRLAAITCVVDSLVSDDTLYTYLALRNFIIIL